MQSTGVVLQTFRGVLALSGHPIDSIAQAAIEANQSLLTGFPTSEAPYHVTLLTKSELRDIPSLRLAKMQSTVDTHQLHCVGIGGTGDVFFVVIIWALGQQIRKQLGFQPKHFHITLSSQDDHEMDKGIDALFPNQFPSSPSPDFLDHLAFTLHAFGQYRRAENFSKDLVLACPVSHRGFMRLADAALSGGAHKLAMLSYACAHARSDDKAQSYAVKKMIECSEYTEWGPTMLEVELTQIPQEISPLLFTPWSPHLRSILSDSNLIPKLQLEPRHTLFIPTTVGSQRSYKLPRFFRWLIPYHIAIMSTPRHEEDISALASPHLGIRHILTLTEEQPLDKSWFRGKSITNTYLPISNYYPPSIEQMDLIITFVEDETKLPLLIHCGGGKGRAGTVAACYMAAFGFGKPRQNQAHPEIPAQEAISLLRQIRPGSIETTRQEAFVSKWCSNIWKRQSVYPDLPSEPPPCPLVVEGSLKTGNDHDLFVLVGLPGSGKSWFSKSLLARNPSGWTLISQDDCGSRSACEVGIGRCPTKGHVLLDRCNTAASDRGRWLDLASNWCTSPVCIWFDYDRDLCSARAQMRAGHPTLPPGSRVRNAVNQMQRVFVRPKLAEGYSAIVIIRSFAAAQEFVLRLSPPIQIYKFPRTPHLLNLGAATSDDVVADVAVLPSHGQVVITEKIDGANMGFSLSSDRSQIIVQNRSHYVDSSTHEQFKKLGMWVENHRKDLYQVLGRDPLFAERYILFGEWMYATHSIPYTHLPDRFIAFDLFDRSTITWADRITLSQVLAGTSISLVPALHIGHMPISADLREMVQMQSKFWDGRVEGVYVKVERNGVVIARGKVVRSDFIAGNEHWTKDDIVRNLNGMSGRETFASCPDDTMAAPSYSLFCMGNPLLDMQVTNGEALLKKYRLNANDAILAEPQHAPIYDELVREHKVIYVAGGASQNAARGAAYVLPPGSVVYTGCVGDDDLAEQLKIANKREGLDQVYQVKEGEKTGACAVVITGHYRSLVTDLRAAEKFDQSHLSSPTVAPLIDAAKFFYVEGYFLTHGLSSTLELSQHAASKGKTFALNLSAPFIAQFFNMQLQQVIPHCDIIIGNEAEAEAWASANGLPEPKDLKAVAKAIASLPKTNPSRPRAVIFTQGAESTILVTSDALDKPKTFAVKALKNEEIVDTNGAGDAFAGGFLGALVAGKSLEESVEVGHLLGGMCVGQVGPQYKWPKVKVF